MMLTDRLRGRWIIGLAALALLLSGCTLVRLGYGNADDLAYVWLDDYIGFTDEQAPKARQALAETLMWHRKTQLPDYAQWLARAGSDASRPTTAAEVCKLTAEVSERISRMSDRLLPTTVEIGLTFTDTQVGHIQSRFDKGQAKFTNEYLKGDARQREAAALKRSISRAESLYGVVDEAQRTVLTQAVKSSPFDAQAMADERATRMRELIQIVKTARTAAAASGATAELATKTQAAVKQWLREGRASPRAAYRAYQQRISDYNCALSAQVHNAADAATRQKAIDRLRGWEDDARALAGQSAL